MSGFQPPPPPNARFAPPPGRGGFAPPPPQPGGFAPPPPQPGGGFAPPPPQQGGFHPPQPGGFHPPPAQPGGGFHPPAPGGFAPPPPVGGGFAPPPPQQNGGVTQISQGMSNMSMQQQLHPPGPQPGSFGHPQPPGGPPNAMAQQPGFGFGQAKPPMGFAPPPPPSPGTASRAATFPGVGAPMVPAPPGAQHGAAPQMPGAAMAAAAPTMNENIDYSVVIPSHLCRWTTGHLPSTAAMASASKIPLGAVLRPLAVEPDLDETSIPTVQPGTAGIVRCKRCRTYINAFVTWSEHGRRWRCNICAQINDCPSAYFCHLDELGLRRDRMERPELSQSVVEFVAPAEYMVRPPQEPTYFFVLDVSATAVRSGMLASAAAAIQNSLDDMPGAGRTKIGFITFDNAVHYYNLSPELANPQMLVVSDLKELFVPLPDHLLVNLEEARTVVDAFLENLPHMFVKNPVVSQSCLGPALKAAFTIVKQIGGKMSVFQSILPNLGDGALKPRDQPGLVGTPNEVKLLKAESPWYKDTAIEFSRHQISVDLYIFPYQYMDLATIGELSKFTSGTMLSYVNFNAPKDGPRFEAQLQKALTQTTAFEAVMRIRCTKGMRITNFYGNFFIRGTDLLALPNCNPDAVFGFDLAFDEQNVSATHVTVQAALLYTSSGGERRIRVLTQALPVTSLMSDVVGSVDADACTALLTKHALDITMKSGSLDNARLRLQQVCVEMIRAAKGGDRRTVSGYSVPPPGAGSASEAEEKPIPEHLQLFPLYTLAMIKNVAFRGGTDIHPDERAQAHYLLNSMWVDATKQFVYPRLFALHEMSASDGLAATGDDDRVAGRNRIRLPKAVNLSVDRLTSNGLFLLDNGVEMYIWVGRMADMNLIGSLFGVHTLDELDPQQISVSTSGDSFASRFGAITQALRESDADPFYVPPKFNIIREGDAHMEARFFWFMIEDRAAFQGGTYSYTEFMQFVNNPQASAGPSARGPPGPGGAAPPGMAPNRPPGAMPPGAPHMGHPPHPGGGMAPPQQPHGMGMPHPPQQPHGMGMAPPQQPPHGMGMPPPQQPPHGMGMAPPPQQSHGIGMAPPPHGMGMPPPPQQGAGAMGPPPNKGMPSAVPGRAMSGPPQAPSSTPGPSGPVTQGPPGPPKSAPSAMPPPPAANRSPLPPPPGAQPNARSYGGPPQPPGGSGGFSGPPPTPQRAGPPPQRGMPPPPPPARSGMPPPPPPR